MMIKPYDDAAERQLLSLYGSVGWTACTACPERLHRAVAGLVQAVGDGVNVLYVQDLLMRPEYQRRGMDAACSKRC